MIIIVIISAEWIPELRMIRRSTYLESLTRTKSRSSPPSRYPTSSSGFKFEPRTHITITQLSRSCTRHARQDPKREAGSKDFWIGLWQWPIGMIAMLQGMKVHVIRNMRFGFTIWVEKRCLIRCSPFKFPVITRCCFTVLLLYFCSSSWCYEPWNRVS